jgi:hypothetical protein
MRVSSLLRTDAYQNPNMIVCMNAGESSAALPASREPTHQTQPGHLHIVKCSRSDLNTAHELLSDKMSRLTFFFALYLVWAIVSSRIFFHQVWAASLLFLPLLVDAVLSQTSWSLVFFFSTIFLIDLAVSIALSPAQILWQNRKHRAKNQPAEEYFLGPESGEQTHRQYAFE